MEGELRDHGPFGVEVQFLVAGELSYAGTFPLRELAMLWAQSERLHIEKGGA